MAAQAFQVTHYAQNNSDREKETNKKVLCITSI